MSAGWQEASLLIVPHSCLLAQSWLDQSNSSGGARHRLHLMIGLKSLSSLWQANSFNSISLPRCTISSLICADYLYLIGPLTEMNLIDGYKRGFA